jgi:hypothetical protein
MCHKSGNTQIMLRKCRFVDTTGLAETFPAFKMFLSKGVFMCLVGLTETFLTLHAGSCPVCVFSFCPLVRLSLLRVGVTIQSWGPGRFFLTDSFFATWPEPEHFVTNHPSPDYFSHFYI